MNEQSPDSQEPIRTTSQDPVAGQKVIMSVIVALGVLLSLGAALLVDRQVSTDARQAFEWGAARHVAALEYSINTEISALATVGDRIGSTKLNRKDFHALVRKTVEKSAFQSIQWVPRVLKARRSQVEASARTAGNKGFRIWDRNADGSSRAARGRDTYFPIIFARSKDDETKNFGFDMASDPAMNVALTQAMETGQLTATQPFQPAPDSQRWRVTVFFPVYAPNRPETPAARRDALRGFVVADIDIARLLETAMGNLKSNSGSDIYVFDIAADNQLLHVYPSQMRPSISHFVPEAQPAEQPHLVRSVKIAGRSWAFLARPYRMFISDIARAQPYFVFAAGLMVSLVFSYLVASLRRSRDMAVLMEELRAKEARLWDLYENAPVAYASIESRSKKIIKHNAAFAEITGFARDELSHLNFNDFFVDVEGGKDRNNAVFNRVVIGETVPNFEAAIKRADGSVIWVNMSVSSLTGSYATNSEIRVSVIDISEQKLGEDLLRNAREDADGANRAKSAFLAAMSHEIRTPMNGVVGMIDLLRESKLDSDQSEMLRTIRDSAFSLLQIINDILDFSKIEAGKMDVEQVAVSLLDTVEGIAGTLLPNASANNVQLLTYVDPAIPDWVLSDPVRLRQILFNLGGNAVKFTRTTDEKIGSVQISADLIETMANGQLKIEFTVKDNGVGIADDSIETLFTAFTQAESSTTRRFGGTGLGLSICKNLTEMLGGRISVDSVVGKGTAFRVVLLFDPDNSMAPREYDFDLKGLHFMVSVASSQSRKSVIEYLKSRGGDVEVLKGVEIDPIIKRMKTADGDGQRSLVMVLGVSWNSVARDALIVASREQVGKGRVGFVSLTADRWAAKGSVASDVVVVEDQPLRRSVLLRGAAVAAGRLRQDTNSDDQNVQPAMVAPSVEQAMTLGRLILVVEDDVVSQQVMRRQLNHLGYAVEIAVDGEQGLAAWENGLYAAVLSDCRMPEMDGFEMTRAIRKTERERGTYPTPIIAITANVLEDETERCREAGMDDILRKPLELGKLRQMLARWLPEGQTPADREKRAPEAAPRSSDPLMDGLAPASDHKRGNDDGENATKVNGQPGETLVDISAIAESFDGDLTVVGEVLCEFIAPSRMAVEEILAKYNANDFQAVSDVAHRLKSSARWIGAHTLSDLCEQLERSGKSNKRAEIEPQVNKLIRTVDEIIEFAQAYQGRGQMIPPSGARCRLN